ncbi:MAG: hypothetical protein Q4C30_05685 [Bacteroidia bacterium]|nr:hypothetical protein [Bacteroidia bacterium]
MRILVTPLDWGLGHASRSAAVVKYLIDKNYEVIIGGSGESYLLLRKQFPSLRAIDIPSFSPWTPSWLPFPLAITIQLPYFFFCIIREYYITQRIARKYNIDLIISDNRYGVHSPTCRAAIITHQLSPIPWIGCPQWIRNIVSWGISKLISKFNFCLIPDYPDHRLSGTLSRTRHISPCRQIFTGPLSRYTEYKRDITRRDIANLGILTGPKEVRRQQEKELSIIDDILIIGSPSSSSLITSPQEIADLIQRSQRIYSHSGYTTIMDLYCLNALSRAFLTPTKGQGEQEYLAALLQVSNK